MHFLITAHQVEGVVSEQLTSSLDDTMDHHLQGLGVELATVIAHQMKKAVEAADASVKKTHQVQKKTSGSKRPPGSIKKPSSVMSVGSQSRKGESSKPQHGLASLSDWLSIYHAAENTCLGLARMEADILKMTNDLAATSELE